MNKVTNAQDVKQLGTILAVWAHPDDETFCAGGLLAAAVRNGQTVICITATRGEAGVQDNDRWPAETMSQTRTDELSAALKELGVTKHHWLDYQDGHCQAVEESKAGAEIAEFVSKYSPDTIITFGPEGLTGHPDHQAISVWVDEAKAQANSDAAILHAVLTVEQYKKYLKTVDQKLNFFYNIDQPPIVPSDECDVCLMCTNELCDCKQKAFASMPSQYTKMREAFDQDYLSEAFRVEAFIRADS